MAAKKKVLVLGDADGSGGAVPALQDGYEIVTVSSPFRALSLLGREQFAGVFVGDSHLELAIQVAQSQRYQRILDGMADGVVLLSADSNIVWANAQVAQWSPCETLVGENFYAAFGCPEILGPDFSPFHTALATGESSLSSLKVNDSHYYQLHASPVVESGGEVEYLIVTLRDTTQEILQQQKLAAIHQAGIELADLKPDEVSQMTVEERIELLKSNILHHTKDLLKYDMVEIRILNHETNKLESLMTMGMSPEAAHRDLMADPQRNGVTGFVAATGKSYLCEDTIEDPLYIVGAEDARSSLTVPLVLHDDVIGTFNVESPEPRAFTESDLQFLEIYTRDLAVAINTLDLLAAEKASTAAESIEAIHRAVALPVDVILNDAVNVMERYIGHEPEVEERVLRILANARDIKNVIQKIGQHMAPLQAHPQADLADQHPKLFGRRILVVDEEESVRLAAHNLLEKYGCTVETAHNGAEASFMVRSLGPQQAYDAVLADIRLPDMSGYDLMIKLGEHVKVVPMILMTGFGWDPGHAIVKARRAGLHPEAVLYKPFRLDQLLATIETILDTPNAVEQP